MANMNFGVNLLPKTNDTYSLGNSDKKWQLNASTINGIAVGNTALTTSASNITDAINEINASVGGLAQRIGNVEAPASVFQDITFSIAQNAWTVINSAYQAEVSNVNITATSGVWVFYDSSYQSYAQAAITSEVYSSGGKVIFRTETQPTGAIGGYIRIVDSITGVVPIERGGTAAGTLAGAQANLGITELNSKIVATAFEITGANNFTIYAQSCFRVGRLVEIHFELNNPTMPSDNTPYTVATVPSGYRPFTYRRYFPLIADNGGGGYNAVGEGVINTNGDIIVCFPNNNLYRFICFHAIYVCDDYTN